MPLAFVVSLAATAVLVLALRLLLPILTLRRAAASISVVNAIAVEVGMLGQACHGGAMFGRPHTFVTKQRRPYAVAAVTRPRQYGLP